MWRGGSGPIIEDGLANWKKKLVILTTIDGLISRKGTRFISLITGLQSHFQNTNEQINKSQQFAQLFALVPNLGWESRFFFYFVLTDGRVCLMISFTGVSVVVVSVNEWNGPRRCTHKHQRAVSLRTLCRAHMISVVKLSKKM